MVNQSIIKAKIAHIEKGLLRLKEKQGVALDILLNNLDLQDIILHNLQLSIQGCIDMASHIISDKGWPAPDTLAGLFDILINHKIIPGELGNRLKMMVGFRNIIIHEYGTIDFKKVHKILNDDINDIHLFLKQVCAYAKL